MRCLTFDLSRELQDWTSNLIYNTSRMIGKNDKLAAACLFPEISNVLIMSSLSWHRGDTDGSAHSRRTHVVSWTLYNNWSNVFDVDPALKQCSADAARPMDTGGSEHSAKTGFEHPGTYSHMRLDVSRNSEGSGWGWPYRCRENKLYCNMF